MRYLRHTYWALATGLVAIASPQVLAQEPQYGLANMLGGAAPQVVQAIRPLPVVPEGDAALDTPARREARSVPRPSNTPQIPVLPQSTATQSTYAEAALPANINWRAIREQAFAAPPERQEEDESEYRRRRDGRKSRNSSARDRLLLAATPLPSKSIQQPAQRLVSESDLSAFRERAMASDADLDPSARVAPEDFPRHDPEAAGRGPAGHYQGYSQPKVKVQLRLASPN